MRTIVVLLLLTSVLSSCDSRKRMEAKGYAQGTTYAVIYHNDGTDLQYQMDSILVAFDRVLSTYQDNSYISRWNRNATAGEAQHPWFTEVVTRSQQVAAHTGGAFDITVRPLMQFWFERNWQATGVDTLALDSLRQFVGHRYITDSAGMFVKADPRVQMDVNAIAQGYSVDVVARYLDGLGITDYLVEIGGEVRARGKKHDGKPWVVGVDRPSEDGNMDRTLAMSLQLNDQALATSGNYRKFVEVNGQKLGHSLDPITGYPATTDVLSATIVAKDAMTADAYATACMVLGVERCKGLLAADTTMHGVLIYDKQGEMETWVSKGLIGQIVNNPKK